MRNMTIYIGFVAFMVLLFMAALCDLHAHDLDTSTIEVLQVDTRHEMYTERDTVVSVVHMRTGNKWWVNVVTENGDRVVRYYDYVKPIGRKAVSK